MIVDKRAKGIQWRKDNLSCNQFWDDWTFTCKKMNLDPDLPSYIRSNSKWITDLNVNYKTIKFLEGNRGGNTDALQSGDVFFRYNTNEINETLVI